MEFSEESTYVSIEKLLVVAFIRDSEPEPVAGQV